MTACKTHLLHYILRALRGRHPLCGTGVLSVIDTTSRPPIVKPLIADCVRQDTEVNRKKHFSIQK